MSPRQARPATRTQLVRRAADAVVKQRRYDHVEMAQNFIACDRDQAMLLPPSLREWLPETTSSGLSLMPSRSSI
jgi:hypothetical protein